MSSHEFIKVKANFHFIDAWSGESGFMKVDGKTSELQYVWTEKYDFSKATNGINICGAAYSESKFSVPIEITLKHSKDSLTV